MNNNVSVITIQYIDLELAMKFLNTHTVFRDLKMFIYMVM